MQQRVHLSSDASSGCWCLLLTCSPAISLYAGRRASAIAGALFAFVRAWGGRSNHARQKARQTSQARRKRRPLRSRHGRTGNQKKRTAETTPARSQAARWGQNPADAHSAAHRASKRPKAGKNTPQKKHPAKRQIQSPQRDRQTPQQKPRRRIPQLSLLNLKAKLSASTRSTTSSFPATWIPARSSRASAGGSQTTPWRHSRWIRSKAQRVRSESGRPQTPPSCGPEWPPERATAARWRKRTAEAAKRQKRLAERPEEAPKKHVRSFSFRKMQKSKNMKKFLRSY